MKRTFLLLIAILLVGTTSVKAQKYGHLNGQEIMMQIPGIDSLQIKLDAFQKELQATGEAMLQEFQAKKDLFDKQAGTMSASVRKVKENELLSLQNNILEFQESAQQDLENKQLELQQPFLDKLTKAIADVAKENGYTYIFDERMLLYSEGGDNVSVLVKKKLGIK
ncbi:MAG: OmpH family outer membrane protein [Bacteroidales bacterium]|nr:OmpH family outer membrane protein [Bacteroidales bacterium]